MRGHRLVWHAGGVLLTLIREVADEPVVLDPAARDAEVRANTWSLSASVAHRASLSPRDVVAAFDQYALLLRERVRTLGHKGTATFYVWHDAQAGVLKCSVTSLPKEQLPFRAEIELGVPLTVIVEEFLSDAAPGRIALDNLANVSTEDIADVGQDDFVLRVWTADVGTSSG